MNIARKHLGQFSAKKDFVKELGALIGRTADAVVRKVGNLASFDPKMKSRGVGGLAHTAKLDEVVWRKVLRAIGKNWPMMLNLF